MHTFQCYRLVRSLVTNMEQVADELMPQYNQLLTLKKCLGELERWNIQLSSREVIPYRMKLEAIERLVCLFMSIICNVLSTLFSLIRHQMTGIFGTRRVMRMREREC